MKVFGHDVPTPAPVSGIHGGVRVRQRRPGHLSVPLRHLYHMTTGMMTAVEYVG